MRPPSCDVCDERVDTDEGALVACLVDEATYEFQRRSETPGFVGHPPNQGWFCGAHLDAAQALADARALADVVATLRGSAKVVDARIGTGRSLRWQLTGSRTAAIERLMSFGQLALAALGHAAVELTRSIERSYTPMDGVGPPDCPFTDNVVLDGGDDGVTIRITHTANYWTIEDLANESAHLSIRSGTDQLLWLAVFGDRPTLSLSLPGSSEMIGAVRDHFDC